MKKKAPAFRLLFFILILIAGCTPYAVPPVPTSTPVPTATATPIPPTATLTPTPSPTPTPAPFVTVPEDGIPQHRMHISLNYADQSMQVRHRILLHNHSADVWDHIVFSVPPAHAAGVFTLHTAEITTAWTRQNTHTTLEGTMLHVHMPTDLPPGEPVEVYLSYNIHIPAVSPDDWLPRGNLGAGARLIQAGDWHPTLVPYKPGEGWQTWVYYPVGDPNIYPLAHYDVTFATDADTNIAAPGEVVQSARDEHYQLRNARSFAFLASPEYATLHSKAGAIPLRVYYLPEYGEAAQAVINTARKVIPLYEEYYGPYPYDSLVTAQNAYHGAMEYSGLVSMSGYAFDTYVDDPLNLLVDLTVHEIAHQWWYGAVGNDQVHEPWLDEAFAKYSECLFYERYYPDLTDRWWDSHIYNRDLSGPLDGSIYDFETTQKYINRVYAQGARFMADLRALMGDADFFTFTQAYRTYGEGRIVTQQDFFAAVRTHTDADLSDLITRYFSP